MSIESCINAYLKLSKDIFQEGKRSRWAILGRTNDAWTVGEKYNSEKLQDAIQRIVQDAGEEPDAKLKKERYPKCRVYVKLPL